MAGHLCPQGADEPLGERDDVLDVDERHLDVELGELRLPVGAEVLVAVAAGDLVVALQAGDHQQLLEQLRALRQRVPVPGLQAHGHQEVACPLGGGPGQRRCLHLDEALVVQHLAGDAADLRAHTNRPGGPRAPQVEVAVPKPGLLAHRARMAVLHRERQGRGAAQQIDGIAHDLHRAGGQVGVLVAGRPDTDPTGDAHARLRAKPARRLLVADDHLDDAAGVTKVDEGDAAVVTSTRNPAGERHGVTDVRLTQGAGTVGAHHEDSSGLVACRAGAVSTGGGAQVPGSAATCSPERMSLTSPAEPEPPGNQT